MRILQIGILFLSLLGGSIAARADSCMGKPMNVVPPSEYPPGPDNGTLPPPPVNPPGGYPGNGDPGGSNPPWGGGGGGIVNPGGPTSGGPIEHPGICNRGNQVSDIFNLSRQTSGYVGYSGDDDSRFHAPLPNTDVTKLTDLLGGGSGTFMDLYAGYALTLNINSGCYIALEFTPDESGDLQFGVNPSYGDGGIISLSTSPGVFGSGAICSYQGGASNNMYIRTSDREQSACPVTIGSSYYVNFADVDGSGAAMCWNGSAYSCSVSRVAYTELVSKKGH